MTNQFNKYSQIIKEAFKGPRTVDYDYEKAIQEYNIGKERMLSLKNMIDSFPSKLENYKLALDLLVDNFASIFDREQGEYFNFMTNVMKAHKTLSEQLLNAFKRFEKLKISMNKWTENSKSVDAKIEAREETRLKFDHYDEKMPEIVEERNKTLSKGKTPSEKDDERYVRNIKKYQDAAKEYIKATNEAYKHIGYFLDSRYDNISLSIIEFIEIEGYFFYEANRLMSYFAKARNHVMMMRKNFRPINKNYDAADFIRGKSFLNFDVDKAYTNRNVPETQEEKNENVIQQNNTFNNNYNNYPPDPFGVKIDSSIPDPSIYKNNQNNYNNGNYNNNNNFNNNIQYNQNINNKFNNFYGDNQQMNSNNGQKSNPYDKGNNNNPEDDPFSKPNI